MIKLNLSEDDWTRLVLYLGYATGAAYKLNIDNEGPNLASRILDLYNTLGLQVKDGKDRYDVCPNCGQILNEGDDR